MRRFIPLYIFALFFSVVVLTFFGIVMLYSTTSVTHGEQMLKRQLVWIFGGVVVALGVHRLDYRRVGRVSRWLLLATALPLAYLATIHVLVKVSGVDIGSVPFTHAVNGAYRWLFIGGLSVQPSEFAKLGIIIFIAHYYGTNPRYLNSFTRGVLRPMAAVGAVVIAIFLGGSLSITAITGGVITGMLFIAGVRLRYFVLLAACGAGLFAFALNQSPERIARLTSFRTPEKFKEHEGYQLWSSQLALGSGGWRGVGFNQSRMKERYLPEAHTDFIIAIVGEELGFLAVLAIVVLYIVLLLASCAIAASASDREGTLLAFGVGLSLTLHAFVNIAVVSGFAPTTGISAPLISYGGSGMVATWLGLGLLLNIARVGQTAGDVDEGVHARGVVLMGRGNAT